MISPFDKLALVSLPLPRISKLGWRRQNLELEWFSLKPKY